MIQNNHSVTAYEAALMRAIHQIFDTPKVFEDPLASRIIGTQGKSDILSGKRKFKTTLYGYLRAGVVARSRFVEDELSAAIERGVRQYVILGAGLDTFAYRNPFSPIGLRVFEVDHPATQKWKRGLLDETRIPIPETLTFVPVDFERQSLADELQKAGFELNEPTFFSWLGVIVYLTRVSMMSTMEYICSSTPSGSGVALDYVLPPSSQDFIRRLVFRLFTLKVARIGEPWINFLDPNAFISDLKAIGFTQVEDIGPEEINARFFKDRTDKLRAGRFGHLMTARR